MMSIRKEGKSVLLLIPRWRCISVRLRSGASRMTVTQFRFYAFVDFSAGEFRRDPNGILDRVGVRAPVRDNADAPNA